MSNLLHEATVNAIPKSDKNSKKNKTIDNDEYKYETKSNINSLKDRLMAL